MDISGARGETYSFVLTEESAALEYRVVLTTR